MRWTIGAFVVLALLAGLAWYVGRPQTMSGENSQPIAARYSNTEYGISFKYSNTYQLEERDAPGSGERRHHIVTLIDTDDAANVPENGEGPTAITVEMFQNNLDRQPVETWIRGTSNSNFKLSPDGALSTTTVYGVTAYSYSWDGLYRGDSVVFEHKNNIFMLSVTYMTPDDQIRKDFDLLVRSVELQ